jgi:hypothetical protein
MVYIQTQNPNLGKFWRALSGKMVMIFFMAIWNILRTLVYFMTMWYILRLFGTFFRFWYHVHAKKNLATLQLMPKYEKNLSLKTYLQRTYPATILTKKTLLKTGDKF